MGTTVRRASLLLVCAALLTTACGPERPTHPPPPESAPADPARTGSAPSDSAPGGPSRPAAQSAQPGSTAAPAHPTPPPPAHPRGFSLRVLASDGAPLAGASVRVQRKRLLEHPSENGAPALWLVDPEPVTRTETAADGAASVGIAASETYVAVATQSGFAPGTVVVHPAPLRPRYEVRLRPGHVLEGRVTDQHGGPLAGARVDLGTSPDRAQGHEPFTVTDPDGRYRFDVVPAGIVRLSAAPRGMRRSESDLLRIPNVSRHDVRVVVHGRFGGVVRDRETGAPLAGARVRAATRVEGVAVAEGTVTSDADGRYVFPSWPQAEITDVRADLAGWYDESGDADPSPLRISSRDDAHRDVWMRRGGAITGVVRGPAAPVADVLVSAVGERFQPPGEVRTGVDGRYRLDGLRPGSYMVVPLHAVQRTDKAAIQPLRVVPPAVVEHDVVLLPGVVVAGRVLDGHGQPVAGAMVSTTEPWERAVADARGAFALRRLPPRTSIDVAVIVPGYPTSEPTRIDTADGRDDVVIRLARGRPAARPVHVRVVDETGVPLRAARALVRSAVRLDPFRVHAAEADLSPVDEYGVLRSAVPASARGAIAYATAPGYAPAAARPHPIRPAQGRDTVDVEVVLRRGAQWHGLVTDRDSGVPIARARVALRRPHERPGTDFEGAVIHDRTGDDGSFACTQLPPGPYELLVTAPGYLVSSVRRQLDADAYAAAHVELERPRTLAGRVVDGRGHPVAGVAVHAFRRVKTTREHAGAATSSGNTGSSVTDDQGRFVIGGLGGRKFTVAVYPGGSGGATLLFVHVDDAPAVAAPHAVELPPVRVIRGVVVAADGRPLEGARMSARRLRDGHEVSVRADSQGRFALVAPADSIVEVRAHGSAGSAPLTVRLPPGEDAPSLELGVGLAIEGVLVWESGEPAVGHLVEATRTDGGVLRAPSEGVRTNEDGVFRIAGLVAGAYELSVEPLGVDRTVLHLEPQSADAGARDLRITVRRAVTIAGVVRTSDAGPLLRATVRLRNGAEVQSCWTDRAGRFAFRGLRPGDTFELDVLSEGFVSPPARTVRAGADDLDLVLTPAQR